MELTAGRSITIPKPRAEVFQFCTNNASYERCLTAFATLPGISKAEMFEGHILEEGAMRRISLEDGVTLDEVILEHDVPSRHRYQWTGGLKPPNSWFVRSGLGDWTFTDVPGGTQIDWKYTFTLTSPLAYPLLMLARINYQRWMAHGLESMRDAMAGPT